MRQQGNGNNNIDVSFIDVDVEPGMYIELAGLAVTGDKFREQMTKNHLILPDPLNFTHQGYYELHDSADIYNLRNVHFYSVSSEHGPAFGPFKANDSLILEFHNRAIIDDYFRCYLFIDEFKLWIESR